MKKLSPVLEGWKRELSQLSPNGYHLDGNLDAAFVKLDHEVERAFAHDPERRGAIRRTLWSARDIASGGELMTNQPTATAALIIEDERPWRFVVAADPERADELLRLLARMAKAEAKRSRRR
jgi:hypothetical protein